MKAAFLFSSTPPNTYPYTGKWVKEDDDSVAPLTTAEYVSNYPNDRAPEGTYVWQVINDTAKIQFDANGGEQVREGITQKTTAPIILDQGITSRDGYKIKSWNTERDGSGTTYQIGSSYIPVLGKNVTLYAQWASIDECAALKYVINGYDNLDRMGIYADPTDNNNQGFHPIGMGVVLTNVEPTRAAHTFLGWSTKEISDIAYLDDDAADAFKASDAHVSSVVMTRGGVDVYAVWQEAYSREIINGGFEVFHDDMITLNERTISATMVSLKCRTFFDWQKNLDREPLPDDINEKTFAWHSTQTLHQLPRKEEDDVEIDVDEHDVDEEGNANHCSQICAEQPGTAIYQDILTMPNNIYKWSLKHATTSSMTTPDSCSVVIGAPDDDDPTVSDATRMTSNGTGQINQTSKIISTQRKYASRGGWDFGEQWETYSGTYVVTNPKQFVTRFSFINIGGLNQLDDITFSISYGLSYDLNGGTSEKIYSSPQDNDYAGYHAAGEKISLPDSSEVIVPEGKVFLGWTKEKKKDLTFESTSQEKDEIRKSIITEYEMPPRHSTLYAVYAEEASVSVLAHDGGSAVSEELSLPEGATYPTWSANIVPDQGFSIDRILVDGKEISISDLDTDETYPIMIEKVIGSHSVEVFFSDDRMQMPHTGDSGIFFLFGLGSLIIVIPIFLRLSRNSIQHTKQRKEMGTD